MFVVSGESYTTATATLELPTYRGKTFYGILVAVNVPEELEKRGAETGDLPGQDPLKNAPG